MKEELVQAEGVVVAMHRNALFDVRLEGTRHIIKARCGGKLQRYLIKVCVGDVVKVEIPSCDTSRGRIVYRMPWRRPYDSRPHARCDAPPPRGGGGTDRARCDRHDAESIDGRPKQIGNKAA